jgi:hypothetical protein
MPSGRHYQLVEVSRNDSPEANRRVDFSVQMKRRASAQRRPPFVKPFVSLVCKFIECNSPEIRRNNIQTAPSAIKTCSLKPAETDLLGNKRSLRLNFLRMFIILNRVKWVLQRVKITLFNDCATHRGNAKIA